MNGVDLDGPGIENFQIIGDAVPGEKLLGCGYQVRGTSLCMFQVIFFSFILVLKEHLVFVSDITITFGCLVGSASSRWH